MADLNRAESSPALESSDRESRVEALLLEGLDQYFSGQYEQAIHLWTRVLFLDRAHARARAYIDRARTALAEQHRRAEELLHASAELIATGQTELARDALARAVAARGDEARATALGWRLEHVERARRGERAASSRLAEAPGAEAAGWQFDGRWLLWGAGGIVVLVVALAVRPVVRAALGLAPVEPDLPRPTEAVSRPVLSSTDVALVRARSLYARGRLAEALQALDRLDPPATSRTAVDELRVEIQQLLLQTGRGNGSGARPGGGGRP
jgi:tetratricopeptide (TPR) repeat protein